MLIVIVASLFLIIGGGPNGFFLTDTKHEIKEEISDPGRREAVLELRAALEQDLDAAAGHVQTSLDDLVAAHLDYDALQADYDRVTTRLVQAQGLASRRILDARDAMREQMTPEEWEAVFAKKVKQ